MVFTKSSKNGRITIVDCISKSQKAQRNGHSSLDILCQTGNPNSDDTLNPPSR